MFNGPDDWVQIYLFYAAVEWAQYGKGGAVWACYGHDDNLCAPGDGTGVTFAPKRGSHSPLNQKGYSPLNNNNLNMLLNPLGFNLGTRGLLGGLGFRGGHGGICWLVSLFHMLLNPLGFNLGTRGLLGGLGFRGGHGGICWLVSLFHMLLNPLGFNLGTRGHLGGLGFRGGPGGICWLVSTL